MGPTKTHVCSARAATRPEGAARPGGWEMGREEGMVGWRFSWAGDGGKEGEMGRGPWLEERERESRLGRGAGREGIYFSFSF